MTTSANKPPSGLVTFLFTDIVDSTEMWEQHGDAFLPVLQAHNAILSDAITRNKGYIIKTEGDSYKVAFADPVAAVRCALVAQAALQRYPWPEDAGPLSVRMAIHSGQPILHSGDYFGPSVNRTARILSASHGGQILLSEEAVDLVTTGIESDTVFRDQGYHTLKDLGRTRLFDATHPAVPSHRFPPVRSLDEYAHNLPLQRTSFIGREKEIEYIASRLTTGDTPLVTLVGPQGIGKTRLAVQASAEIIERFPDNVWYVRLDSTCDAEGAALETAKIIGLTIPEGANSIEVLREYLAHRQCLIVLDDCGHVPEAGRFIRELLSGTSSLRCLATSVNSLRDEGGDELTVPEMTLPVENADAGGVLESEAGRLFVERARESRPDFELTDQRAKPISRLLRRLPGAPDIIEKAAGILRNPEATASRILDALSTEKMQAAGQVAATQGKVLLERMKQSPGLAALLQSLGGLAADRSELAEAEQKCREALAIHEKNGDRHGLATTLRQLGNIAFAQKDYKRAIVLLGAAHQAFSDMNSPETASVAVDLQCARHALGDAESEHLPVSMEMAVTLALARS